MTLAYIGLGSNLGDREAVLLRAVDALDAVRISPVIETEPWGFADQPPFLNAVAEVETDLSARGLLELLLDIEQRLGRTRTGPRYGPRTIDLDLLLYGHEVIDEPGLRVPHPRLAERRFVLEPLAALVPERKIPGNGTVQEALARIQSDP